MLKILNPRLDQLEIEDDKRADAMPIGIGTADEFKGLTIADAIASNDSPV